MKRRLALVYFVAFLGAIQMASADFKVQNGSIHTITVQLVGKSPQTVKGKETVIFVTSRNDVTVKGPFGLKVRTEVPRDKTMIVEYKFGDWSFSFKR